MSNWLDGKRTALVVGLVFLWGLIGIVWMVSPANLFVGYLRFRLVHRLLGGEREGDFNVEEGRRGALLTIVRNGSRRSIVVSHRGYGLSATDVLCDVHAGSVPMTGYSRDDMVRVNGKEVEGTSAEAFVIVGDSQIGDLDIRSFPADDNGGSDSAMGPRELPSVVVLSYGECVVVGMVVMIVTLMLPHPGRIVGMMLLRQCIRLGSLAQWHVGRGRSGERKMVKKHVFLSYCHADGQAVATLRDGLIQRGEAVWWDGEIRPGEDWKLAIRQAIQDSYVVIVVLSENLNNRVRSGVFPEVLHAVTILQEYSPGSIYLIPVRLTACEIPAFEIDSNRMLNRLQHVDLFPSSQFDNALDRLIQAIRAAPEHP